MQRLVLDTNVWLDWLVFDNAGIALLKAAAVAGQVKIYIDEPCALELAAVLAYPLRKQILAPAARAQCMAECRRIACEATLETRAEPSVPLPVCRDADDQKFLELARACGADFLVTKDKLLLKLARRKVRRAPFQIVTPAQFAADFAGR